MTASIRSIDPLRFDEGARQPEPVVAFLRSNFREDHTNGNGSFISSGFAALRRVQINRLFRKYGVPLERTDLNMRELVSRAQIAFQDGKFGTPDTWSARPENDALKIANEKIADQAQKIDRLESMMAKFLESQMEKPSGRNPSGWNLLQKRAKALGINISGKDREALESEIKALEGVP